MFAKPGGALPDSLRLGVKGGRRGQECLIIDVSDRREIRVDSSPDSDALVSD